MSIEIIEAEKKRLTAFLAEQTLVHEGTKQRARAYCDSVVTMADFAIETLKDHVANQIAGLEAQAAAFAALEGTTDAHA
jgi:hypothetical protein